MTFLDNINSYISGRKAAIETQKVAIATLQGNYNTQLVAVSTALTAYQGSLSDIDFTALQTAQSTLATTSANLATAQQRLSVMNIGWATLSNSDIDTQISSYLAGVGLASLQAAILAAKSAYLTSMQAYVVALQGVHTTRVSIEAIGYAILPPNKVEIEKDLYSNTLYNLTPDYFVSNLDYSDVINQIEHAGPDINKEIGKLYK